MLGADFIWITDCGGLKKFLENQDDPNHMLQRRRLQLLRFNFTIHHRPGKLMTDVDNLSRYNQITALWCNPYNPDQPSPKAIVPRAAWRKLKANPTCFKDTNPQTTTGTKKQVMATVPVSNQQIQVRGTNGKNETGYNGPGYYQNNFSGSGGDQYGSRGTPTSQQVGVPVHVCILLEPNETVRKPEHTTWEQWRKTNRADRIHWYWTFYRGDHSGKSNEHGKNNEQERSAIIAWLSKQEIRIHELRKQHKLQVAVVMIPNVPGAEQAATRFRKRVPGVRYERLRNEQLLGTIATDNWVMIWATEWDLFEWPTATHMGENGINICLDRNDDHLEDKVWQHQTEVAVAPNQDHSKSEKTPRVLFQVTDPTNRTVTMHVYDPARPAPNINRIPSMEMVNGPFAICRYHQV